LLCGLNKTIGAEWIAFDVTEHQGRAIHVNLMFLLFKRAFNHGQAISGGCIRND
jgi:hypothetical protein